MMMQNAQRKKDGCNEHMAADAAAGNLISTEELLKQYKEHKRFTTGAVFGVGNGELGTAARNKVIRHNRLRKEKESAATTKMNQKLRAEPSWPEATRDKGRHCVQGRAVLPTRRVPTTKSLMD